MVLAISDDACAPHSGFLVCDFAIQLEKREAVRPSGFVVNRVDKILNVCVIYECFESRHTVIVADQKMI